MRKKYNGFGIVEALLIVAVLIIIGALGWVFFGKQLAKQVFEQGTVKDLPYAHNSFGFDLLKELNKQNKNDNIFISPTSTSLALSMVYNGARGSTKDAMAKTLHVQNLDIATVNKESLGLINSFKNKGEGVELNTANSLWIRNGASLNSDFKNQVTGYYDSTVTTLDFSSKSAPYTINKWVSEKTKNKIPHIVDSTADQEMFLINATYFKGVWKEAFDKTSSRDLDFTPADGKVYKHNIMKRSGDMKYFETDDLQSVMLPYGKDEKVSMCIFLPKDMQSFVDKLDAKTWNSYMARYAKEEGNLYFPSFKLEYSVPLKEPLIRLGMNRAFSGGDFSGIGPNLIISGVQHKTFIDVNEEGTEAAAVTSVGMIATSANSPPPKRTFNMEVSRPFFIAIRDNDSQEVLFAGIIQRPVK